MTLKLSHRSICEKCRLVAWKAFYRMHFKIEARREKGLGQNCEMRNKESWAGKCKALKVEGAWSRAKGNSAPSLRVMAVQPFMAQFGSAQISSRQKIMKIGTNFHRALDLKHCKEEWKKSCPTKYQRSMWKSSFDWSIGQFRADKQKIDTSWGTLASYSHHILCENCQRAGPQGWPRSTVDWVKGAARVTQRVRKVEQETSVDNSDPTQFDLFISAPLSVQDHTGLTLIGCRRSRRTSTQSCKDRCT